MAIKPILHRILVKPDVLEEVDEVYKRAKAAGLSLDFAERDREQAAVDTGVVLDFGNTVFKDFGADNPLKVGVKVVYAKYAGKTIRDPEDKTKKLVLLNDEDVIAIVTEEV